jgi:hypothetical protein
VRTARPKSGGALLQGLLADVGVEARMKSNEADHRLTPQGAFVRGASEGAEDE